MAYYNPRDSVSKKAREQEHAAHSFFKLEELDQRFHLFCTKPLLVLDLGCAPGSWVEYCAARVGDAGLCVGIDLKPVSLAIPQGRFVQGDVFDPKLLPQIAEENGILCYDLILCDMSPTLTGIRIQDQVRAFTLWEAALNLSRHWLRPGGTLVIKLFEGEELQSFLDLLEPAFNRSELFRPKTTRKHSREIYLVASQKLNEILN